MNSRIHILDALLVFLLLLLLLPVFVVLLTMPMGEFQPMFGDTVWWLPAWVFFIGVLALLLVIGYRVVTLSRRDPAIEELRVAFARGDIDPEEYDQRLSELEDT